ncbi:MAG: dTMP kinase [Stellaceae bacterium]
MARSGSGKRGKFITIEGGEGAGKTTQVRLLVEALGRAGIAAHGTREPGGSPGGEAIRHLLLDGAAGAWDATSEALLMVAARREHVVRTIRPALAQGVWIVCDRFADSTLAYQGYGGGLPVAALLALHRFALGDFVPDLTVILDLPVKEGLARAAARGGGSPAAGDRFERRDRAFHERLRQGFLAIARADPARCAIVDAGAEVAAVHRAVLAVVAQRAGVIFA